MKKKLDKSLKRIQKNNPNLSLEDEENKIKKLSPFEISLFRNLQKKYDLTIQNINEQDEKESTEISENAKKTLERIKNGLPFVLNEE
tara:strand:- start:473 stop:733 length:261 start_codon:yes stop_codon:yes gene_type:complete